MRPEDKSELSKLVSTIKEGYSEKYEEAKRHWGGGIMGQKAIARTEKKRKALEVSFSPSVLCFVQTFTLDRFKKTNTYNAIL